MSDFRSVSQFLLGTMSAGIAACVSAPSPGPGPVGPPIEQTDPITPPPSPVQGSATFIFRDGTSRYEVQQVATVSVSSSSTPVLESTVRMTAGLSTNVSTAAGSPLISIMVDSVVVMSSRDSMIQPRRLAAPIRIELPISGPSLLTPEDSSSFLAACDSMEGVARAIGSDLYPELRTPLLPGQRWSDTMTTILCRGGIPLTLTVTSSFDVLPIRQLVEGLVMDVVRRSTVTVAGTGTQGSRSVSVTGQGTSNTRLTYDIAAGRLLQGIGQSLLDLQFETLQQTEQVKQQSSLQIRLIPGF